MNQTTALSAETLLQHEPFVRAVVRGLLSDEGRVQDVVQETWLTALQRPPRAGSSLRAWLARVAKNLARDSHRSTGRRTARERMVARGESVESVDTTFERLAGQREVVDVVLALKEPYKSVVLLHYYQELDAAEMAKRLGRSAGTVRSQLSRAHEILGGGLESKFGGAGAGWGGLGAPFAPEALGARSATKFWATTPAKATVAVGVVVAGALAVVVVPRWLEPHELRSESRVGLGDPAAGGSPPSVEATFAPALVDAGTRVREPVQSAPPVALDPQQRAQLDGRSMSELRELAVQTQRAIEAHLLVPDERILAQHAALLTLPRTGICRLLDGNGTESRFDHAITKRGGGAYFSFATRDHSYDAEPDLSLHDGKFKAGFYGIQLGLLMDVGDVALAQLPERGDSVPGELADSQREAWDVLWSDITLEDAAHGSAFRQRRQGLRRSIAIKRSTFLLRVFSPNEHDHLVAFRPLDFDDQGCTLAWRVLRTWPVPGEHKGAFQARVAYPEVPVGPTWLTEMSLDELMQFLALVRAQAAGRLLEVPGELAERYSGTVGESPRSFAETSGFARILRRGEWDPLVEMRGGGAYYSFHSRSNDYDEEPELELQQGRYSSGFAGRDRGFLLDLGEVPFDQLAAVMSGSPPSGFSERERAAWDFLWNARATVQAFDDGERRALSEADEERAAALGLGRSVPAIVGHTYLLRSILFDTHDHLVTFTVIGGDEFGHTLAWRIQRSWPVEQTSRGR
ncbi:MAG: RNA polymerase sigma factor [Planctomycetota bacterium]